MAFAHIGKDRLMDKIPLREVIAVELVTPPATQSSVTGLASLETAVDFSRSFQIRTDPNGSNAGRKYFLQAENDTECMRLVSVLQNFARSALNRSKSPGQRRQDFVRMIYNSNAFQSFAAVLIILVRIAKSLLSFCREQ